MDSDIFLLTLQRKTLKRQTIHEYQSNMRKRPCLHSRHRKNLRRRDQHQFFYFGYRNRCRHRTHCGRSLHYIEHHNAFDQTVNALVRNAFVIRNPLLGWRDSQWIPSFRPSPDVRTDHQHLLRYGDLHAYILISKKKKLSDR